MKRQSVTDVGAAARDKKPRGWGRYAFAAILLFLGSVVVTRALSGPQTTSTKKDMIKAERVLQPRAGVDDRVLAPQGNLIAGNGVVEPADRETKVSPAVAGRLGQIFVKEGDMVLKGTALAELDNGPEKAFVDASEGELSVSRAELTRTLRGLRKEDVEAIVADTESTRSRASISASTLERTESLAKTGAATPDELDRARKQAEADKSSVTAAEARRKAAVSGSRSEDVLVAQARVQASLARRDQAKAQLERLTIRAPIAGQILQVKSRAGEYFNPQAAEPILVMGDTQRLRVRMDVDERDIGKVAVGATAFATLNAFPERKFAGKVSEIGRRMGRKNIRTDDPVERIDTKILEVVIDLEKADGLVPGLRVSSYIALEKKLTVDNK
jgi:HlyD family secretion protein